MATHHALPAEIVDLDTWAQDMPGEQTKAIVKTAEMELARLVLAAGKELPTHKVSGPIIVHCLTGEITLTAMGKIQSLMPGQLLHLAPNEPHSVQAIADSVFLLTIIFKD